MGHSERSKLYLFELVKQEEWKNGANTMFEVIMVRNFPKKWKDITPHI